MMYYFKVKLHGRKQTVRILGLDEVIISGDLQLMCKDLTKDEVKEAIKVFSETNAVGDYVSEHPGRTYIRIKNE